MLEQREGGWFARGREEQSAVRDTGGGVLEVQPGTRSRSGARSCRWCVLAARLPCIFPVNLDYPEDKFAQASEKSLGGKLTSSFDVAHSIIS